MRYGGEALSDREGRRNALFEAIRAGSHTIAATQQDWRRRIGLARLARQDPTRLVLADDMHARLDRLAAGSQPAIVKIVSFGDGASAAGKLAYVSRKGSLALETESGERVGGHEGIERLRAEWSDLFCNRPASRDTGLFQLRLASETLGGERDALVRDILHSGFAGRRFVYSHAAGSEPCAVWGLVVLRGPAGDRLTGGEEAAAKVQARLGKIARAGAANARFDFVGHGHGTAYAGHQMRKLLHRSEGPLRDQDGRVLASTAQVSELVNRVWRKELASRRCRDVMHLVVSARSGTDAARFNHAVRDFLGSAFAAQRYAFATHDPDSDPQERTLGGRRPHIHAHAIITMRLVTGERFKIPPSLFRTWRMTMAHMARRQNIAMEMTDRREFASPRGFGYRQVRPVSYVDRTEHVGTSRPAQMRHDEKRADLPTLDRSPASRDYAEQARSVWQDIAAASPDRRAACFALAQAKRIATALRERQGAGSAATGRQREELTMRGMDRQQLERYERRVEAVLDEVRHRGSPEQFASVAAAAREIVALRRQELELREANRRQVEGHADRHRQRAGPDRTDDFLAGPDERDCGAIQAPLPRTRPGRDGDRHHRSRVSQAQER